MLYQQIVFQHGHDKLSYYKTVPVLGCQLGAQNRQHDLRINEVQEKKVKDQSNGRLGSRRVDLAETNIVQKTLQMTIGMLVPFIVGSSLSINGFDPSERRFVAAYQRPPPFSGVYKKALVLQNLLGALTKTVHRNVWTKIPKDICELWPPEPKFDPRFPQFEITGDGRGRCTSSVGYNTLFVSLACGEWLVYSPKRKSIWKVAVVW